MRRSRLCIVSGLCIWCLCTISYGARVAEYLFDDVSVGGAGYTSDTSGNGNTLGQIVGANWTGHAGSGNTGYYGFSGTGACLYSNNSDSWNTMSQTMSFTGWVFSIDNGVDNVAEKGLNSWRIWVQAYNLHFSPDGGNATAYYLGSVPFGTWTHVGVVFDNTAHTLVPYINGIAGTTITNVATMTPNTSDVMYAGYWADGHRYYGGWDNFRFYNHLITATDVVRDRDTDNTRVLVTAGEMFGLAGGDGVVAVPAFGEGGFVAAEGDYDGVIRVLVDQGAAKVFDRMQITNPINGATNYCAQAIRCLVASDEAAAGFDPKQFASYTQEIASGNLTPVINSAGTVRAIDITSISRRYFLLEIQSNIWGTLDPDTNNTVHFGDIALVNRPDTVNASTYGYNAEDATDALQAAINSGARVVNVPNMGTDWIVRPITLVSDQTIVFASGVNVVAKRNEFQDVHDSLFKGSYLTNVKLIGYGATFKMWKSDYAVAPYTKGEWRMGINLVSCSNVEISGLTIKDTGGDGIYLVAESFSETEPPCSNIVIKDVVCDNNYRQGMSVCSVNDLAVENCVFRATSGTAPMAGIDFEPNFSTDSLSDISVKNCMFETNDSNGIIFETKNLASAMDYDAIIENCTFYGNKSSGLRITSVSPFLIVKDCLFVNNVSSGVCNAGATSFSITYSGLWGNGTVTDGLVTLNTGCVTTIQPIFASTTFGDANYLYLASNCPATITTGASDGGFMGSRPKVSAPLFPGDANGDGMVDVGDLGILAANYGGANKTWAQGDFNGDKLVDVGDLGILAANYGKNASNADWAIDYAKAFDSSATNEDNFAAETNNSICSGLGLPLVVALAMMGLMLVKLEE